MASISDITLCLQRKHCAARRSGPAFAVGHCREQRVRLPAAAGLPAGQRRARLLRAGRPGQPDQRGAEVGARGSTAPAPCAHRPRWKQAGERENTELLKKIDGLHSHQVASGLSR